MNAYKITFSDGSTIDISFCGTLADAEAYYVDKWFDIGNGENYNMQKGVKVDVRS